MMNDMIKRISKNILEDTLLIAAGVICPTVFFFGRAGRFAAALRLPDALYYLQDCCQTASILFFGLGPIGFAALLTVLIREREKLSLFVWIPLFLLLLLNLWIIILTLLVLRYDYLWENIIVRG